MCMHNETCNTIGDNETDCNNKPGCKYHPSSAGMPGSCLINTDSSVPYALAKLPNPIRGTKDLAFVHLPSGTEITSHSEYAKYCEDSGFSQNLNAGIRDSFKKSNMYDSTNYYCNTGGSACELQYSPQGTLPGKVLGESLTNFRNFGLPLNTKLRIRDRGGTDPGTHWIQFAYYQSTGNHLQISDDSSYRYLKGTNDMNTNSPSSFPTDGVIVCQEK
jgi:hypothetical protein